MLDDFSLLQDNFLIFFFILKQFFILNICTAFYSVFFSSFYNDQYFIRRSVFFTPVLRDDDLFFLNLYEVTNCLMTCVDSNDMRIYRVLYLDYIFERFRKLFVTSERCFIIILQRLWKKPIFISFICLQDFTYTN